MSRPHDGRNTFSAHIDYNHVEMGHPCPNFEIQPEQSPSHTSTHDIYKLWSLCPEMNPTPPLSPYPIPFHCKYSQMFITTGTVVPLRSPRRRRRLRSPQMFADAYTILLHHGPSPLFLDIGNRQTGTAWTKHTTAQLIRDTDHKSIRDD